MPLSVSCAAGGRIVAGLLVALGWCWRVDSNHRPTDYESVALPAELRQPASRARRVSPHYISGKTGDRPPFSFAAMPQDSTRRKLWSVPGFTRIADAMFAALIPATAPPTPGNAPPRPTS